MPKAGAASSTTSQARTVEERIVDAAFRLYAEHGFEIPLSRIARAARVTPAVLTRRVGTKKALLDRVFKRLFAGRWKPEWDALLVDRSIPLEHRLSRFFVEYRCNIDRAGARLWMRAGLLGLHGKADFSGTLARRILIPVIQELRHEAGLGTLLNRKVSETELEIAQILHGAIAFPHIRSHLYEMAVHGTLADLVPMIVRVWLPGAQAEILRLNA